MKAARYHPVDSGPLLRYALTIERAKNPHVVDKSGLQRIRDMRGARYSVFSRVAAVAVLTIALALISVACIPPTLGGQSTTGSFAPANPGPSMPSVVVGPVGKFAVPVLVTVRLR